MNGTLKHIDQIGISIVIVTHNGCSKLATTLEHLAKQEHLHIKCELLVIDNNSNDGSSTFVKDYWQSLKEPYPLRVLMEPNPGTMYARQRGIVEAAYRYLLFCDDDNWLHSRYVVQAFKLIEQNPQIAVVGGLGIMTYEPSFLVPSWMCEQFRRSFGTGPQGKTDGDTTYDKGCLYTAGAVFDRVWLQKLYNCGFTTALKGRDSKSLIAGEDTELTIALKIIGGQLHYSSQLYFKHFMTKERITWNYLKKLWRGFGASNFFVSPYKQGFNHHKYNYIKQLYLSLMNCMTLYIKKISSHAIEGDISILEFEMAKGRLYAMLFKKDIFNKSRQMALLLLKHKV